MQVRRKLENFEKSWKKVKRGQKKVKKRFEKDTQGGKGQKIVAKRLKKKVRRRSEIGWKKV